MKFPGKILLLGILVLAGQVALDACLPPPVVPNIVREVQMAYDYSHVFFGDSVNAACSATDSRRLPISQLLMNKLDRLVAGISRGGYDMMVYRDFAREIIHQKQKQRRIIIEVNLSTFSGDGRSPFVDHENVTLTLRRQTRWWLRVFDRPLHIFHFPPVRPAIRLEEYMNRDIIWQGRVVGKQKQFEGYRFMTTNVTDELMRDFLIIRYGNPMTADNRMLAATQELAELLKKNGQRAVFYITPVNVQRCDPYWNGAISKVLAEKAELIKSRIAAGGGECVDLSFALGTEYFDTPHYPNEHLNEAGRDFVAQTLADYLTANPDP